MGDFGRRAIYSISSKILNRRPGRLLPEGATGIKLCSQESWLASFKLTLGGNLCLNVSSVAAQLVPD